MKTKVVFRKFKEGDVIALFPEYVNRRAYRVECYQHIGQHGEADYTDIISITKPATEQEYADLAAELRGIGYDLTVRKRAKVRF